jgi:hypothetical protein
MRGERQADQQVGFAAAGLAAVEELVGLAEEASVCGPTFGTQTRSAVA